MEKLRCCNSNKKEVIVEAFKIIKAELPSAEINFTKTEYNWWWTIRIYGEKLLHFDVLEDIIKVGLNFAIGVHRNTLYLYV